MAFDVVLFSLVAQGGTMRPLLKRLKRVSRVDSVLDYQRRHARLVALRSAEKRLDEMHRDGLLSSHSWELLKAALTERVASLARKVQETLNADPDLVAAEMQDGRRELLIAQRSALMSMRIDDVISDDIFEELVAEIDVT